MLGGSESRFVMGNLKSSAQGLSSPSQYLMVENDTYGTRAIVGNKDPGNRLQKFRIQETKKGSYIRFDNHPQPALRASSNGTVELYNASTDNMGEWAIAILSVANGGLWRDTPSEPINLSADEMKKTKKFRAVLMNRGNNRFLGLNGSGEVVLVELQVQEDGANKEELSKEIEKHHLLWEFEYVGSQWSMSEVAIGVTAPVAFAAACVAAAACPLFGACNVRVWPASAREQRTEANDSSIAASQSAQSSQQPTRLAQYPLQLPVSMVDALFAFLASLMEKDIPAPPSTFTPLRTAAFEAYGFLAILVMSMIGSAGMSGLQYLILIVVAGFVMEKFIKK